MCVFVADLNEYIDTLEQSLEKKKAELSSMNEEIEELNSTVSACMCVCVCVCARVCVRACGKVILLSHLQVEALKADTEEKEGMVLVEGGAMERIRRASELALTEMKLMGAQVVEEQKRRKEAERLVQHSVSEMQAARRQSAIMKGSTVDQKQLSEALAEIETLNNQLAELQSKHKEEVRGVGVVWCHWR